MLLFGRLWYGNPNAVANPISYAKFYSRSDHAVIRVYGEAANVIETHEQAGEFNDEANPALCCELWINAQPNSQSAGWLISFSLDAKNPLIAVAGLK